MSHISDREYFATRAGVERSLSETSHDPNLALIHEQLAKRYQALAAGHNEPRSRLQIVGGFGGMQSFL